METYHDDKAARQQQLSTRKDEETLGICINGRTQSTPVDGRPPSARVGCTPRVDWEPSQWTAPPFGRHSVDWELFHPTHHPIEIWVMT